MGCVSRKTILIPRSWVFAGLLGLGLATYGCIGMESLIEARDAGEGVSKVYPLGKTDALRMSYIILKAKNRARMDSKSHEGQLVGTISQTTHTWDLDTHTEKTEETLVGVWVEGLDQTESRVTCVSLRQTSLGGSVALTEAQFHEQLEQFIKESRSESP